MGQDVKPIPTIHFRTDRLPRGSGFKVLQAAKPHYTLSLPAGTKEEDFWGRSSLWFLGEMILIRSHFDPFDFSRTPDQIQADGLDTYNFTFIQRGSWSVSAGGRDFVIRPGHVGVTDMSRPFEVTTTAFDSIHLVVGRVALDNALRSEFDIAGHNFDGTGGAVLADYMASLARNIAHVTSGDVEAIRKATLAQIASAVSLIPSPDKLRGNPRGVLSAVQRYIERNLSDPALTPERIVEAVGISRSSLYRHFEAYGGIAAYIQRRRLQAIHALLLHPDETRSIGELAQTFGFQRASHFTTAFRRTFGCTPRLLRSTSGRASAVRSSRKVAEAPVVFRDWMGEISSAERPSPEDPLVATQETGWDPRENTETLEQAGLVPLR